MNWDLYTNFLMLKTGENWVVRSTKMAKSELHIVEFNPHFVEYFGTCPIIPHFAKTIQHAYLQHIK
jgi:hypothetical protein